MGKDPNTAVTNENAQVYDIDNLYISGPSLFPTYGFANPFLTRATAVECRVGVACATRDATDP